MAEWVERVVMEMADRGVPVEAIGPTLVQGFARFYRRLPTIAPGVDKSQVPLLYQLLGSGTSPLKMSKEDASYQTKPVGQQRCENCSSSYMNTVTGEWICSQVEGQIDPHGWSRLWNSNRF